VDRRKIDLMRRPTKNSKQCELSVRDGARRWAMAACPLARDRTGCRPDATRYVCKAILHCSKFGSLASSPTSSLMHICFDVHFARSPAASSSWGNYVLASCSGGQTSRQNIHLHRLLQTMRLVILILIIIGC